MEWESIVSGAELASYLQITAPRGRLFFTDTVDLAVEKPELLNGYSKLLLPILSEKYHLQASSIDNTMRNVLSRSWKKNPRPFEKLMGCALPQPPTLYAFLWGAYLLLRKNKNPYYRTGARALEPFQLPVTRGYIAMTELVVLCLQNIDFSSKRARELYRNLPSYAGLPQSFQNHLLHDFILTCRDHGNPEFWRQLAFPGQDYLLAKYFVYRLLLNLPVSALTVGIYTGDRPVPEEFRIATRKPHVESRTLSNAAPQYMAGLDALLPAAGQGGNRYED